MARNRVVKRTTIANKMVAPSLGATHPVNHKNNKEKLLKFAKSRLDFAHTIREPMLQRFEAIDKTVSGYIELTAEERTARNASAQGDPKPGKMQLPLVYKQLDEIVTYFMQVFSPDSSMYEALANRDVQDPANAFALLMNKNAKFHGYYREYAKFLFDSLKYNLGGATVYWEKVYGANGTVDVHGKFQQGEQVVEWEGSNVRAVDMYNTLWDVSVHPVDVPTKGEFFATVEVKRRFALERMRDNNEIFITKEMLDEQLTEQTYYRSPPDVVPAIVTDGSVSRGTIDWVNVLSGGAGTEGNQDAYEIVNFVCWLRPKDFKLGSAKSLEIWRITIMGMKHIIATEKIGTAHGMLPIAFGSPVEDGLGLRQKSQGEMLAPLQEFGSFLLNTHMAAVRKALHGIQIYDPTIADLSQIKDGVSARIACSPLGYGKDLRLALVNLNDAPTTEGTMRDIAALLALMQDMLPSDINKQVAGLDRATQYQAAATVQGGHGRSLKMAKTLNDQILFPIRKMQYINILEFQPVIEIVGPNGEKMTVGPTMFKDLGIEYIIAEGLKSLDRLSVILIIKDVLNATLQSQTASAQIDVVALMNYLTKLMGDEFDLTQFRIQQPVAPIVAPEGTVA